MKLAYLTIVFLLMVFIACGCSKQTEASKHIEAMAKTLVIPEKTFLSITNGATFEMIRDMLGASACHEFTVGGPNGDYTLISTLVSVDDGVKFWILFHDKRVTKIIRPISPEIETYSYKGTTASRLKSWSIDDTSRIRKTIESPPLTHDLILSVLDDLRPKERNSGHTIGDQVGNAIWVSVLRGFSKRMAPQMERDYEVNQYLRRKYDGCRVDVGMSAKEVEKIYGKPLRVFSTKSGETVQVFGEIRDLEVNHAHLFSCVAVVFDSQGRISNVYSHEFFNDDWKQ